jgi:2-polyprenyl-3-methyl-5-hydroxy-6-metoxy-1,4-benzoquinol methylase
MNLAKLLFEKSYGHLTPDKDLKNWQEQEIVDFQKIWQEVLPVMETLRDKSYFPFESEILILGSGLGFLPVHFEKFFHAKVWAVDFSTLAISFAKTKFPDSLVEWLDFDVTLDWIKLKEKKFDFIYDHHLLHCLFESHHRNFYLTQIKNHLKDDGMYFGETMVWHKNIQLPYDYTIDEHNRLWQLLADPLNKSESKYFPIRYIASSLAIEEELIQAGHHICYFLNHSELHFPLGEVEPLNSPQVLRFLTKK